MPQVDRSGTTSAGIPPDTVATPTHVAAAKAIPVDADELPLADSAASYGLKKLLWSDLKATLVTFLNTLFVAITSATGSAKLPVGTTAQRDGGTPTGYLRYNSTLSQFEGYGSAGWGKVGGGATGGGTDSAFYENDQTITTNYTLTTNKNAMTAGPITIADGITVTIPTGATWSIV